MIDVIFDKDEIYESVNHFLDRSQVCCNFTGEHTRTIYQSKVDDNTNLREGLNRAIMNLDQVSPPLTHIMGYKGFELILEQYFNESYQENLNLFKNSEANNKYENFQLEIECNFVDEKLLGESLYTFFFAFLLDTQDNYKIKAFSFHASLDCVREYEDFQWMLWQEEPDYLSKDFMNYEKETFNQILYMSKDYWNSMLNAVLIALGMAPSEINSELVIYKKSESFYA